MTVAPETVTITGHNLAKAGETIKLKCESGISNPAAVLTWFSGRDKLEGAVSEVVPSEKVIKLYSRLAESSGKISIICEHLHVPVYSCNLLYFILYSFHQRDLSWLLLEYVMTQMVTL